MRGPLEKSVGTRIRNLRMSRGISQEELAAICKCHRTYVGMVERAEKSISVSMLSRFAKALNTNMSTLLDGL